jgi:hypothetical protein
MAIAPSISADRPSPCEVQQVYLQLLAGSGVDIVLLQDSVGAQQWGSDIVSHDAPYFAAFQAACQATGVRLWADTECFQITPTNWLACDAARLKQQFAATAPFVEEFVTFDFLNYMNPVAFLSSWNQARRASMLKLFADYKAQFVSADYAPLGPPQISASWVSNAPVLNWGGAIGDQFQVQFKTSLADRAWTPLPAAVLTNGEAFSIVDAGAPAQDGHPGQRLGPDDRPPRHPSRAPTVPSGFGARFLDEPARAHAMGIPGHHVQQPKRVKRRPR